MKIQKIKKIKLNFELYGQNDKITTEAGEKGPFFSENPRAPGELLRIANPN